MSDVMTASEAKQILDAIQALTVEVKVNQARTEEQFKTLRAEVKAEINELRAEVKAEINELRTEVKAEIKALNDKVDTLRSDLRDDINELRDRQKAIDSRLWAFIVGLVTLVGGGVIKVLWFDRA
ncbi:hypothetical protein RIF25_05390 [Thermosynechococcaceae cyanobacterium BACA0444]|uniref:DUF1640 domain-containing protein n=1 Tax=Pseudocalidococcus azoricus BACA0444 TaxID=2918990 RepID=A0AAE4JVD3_9CYAN|nr:hypothetical protein [Pseudocalidococcus azoricus]MDS3860235.1 hypothetical protein [Pseudocalidococcus azoricus BACA0444]